LPSLYSAALGIINLTVATFRIYLEGGDYGRFERTITGPVDAGTRGLSAPPLRKWFLRADYP
jgi:hypothetical protein